MSTDDIQKELDALSEHLTDGAIERGSYEESEIALRDYLTQAQDEELVTAHFKNDNPDGLNDHDESTLADCKTDESES